MQIKIRADSVEIEGYVNAVERKSNPLMSRMGKFVERICKGAFKRALDREDDVKLLLNHDDSKVLGSTKQGNLELNEDNIGLHARATITDPDVVQKAKHGDLRGWSFGFMDRDVEQKRDEDGMPLRDVKDMDLKEVSLLDKTRTPAYDGTLVLVRSEEDSVFIGDEFTDEIQIREVEESYNDDPKQQETVEEKNINYDEAEALIEDMKS